MRVGCPPCHPSPSRLSSYAVRINSAPTFSLSGQWAGVGEEEEAAELKHAKRPAHLELGPLPAGHSKERAGRPLSLRAQAVCAQSGAGGRGRVDRGVCAGVPWAEAGTVDWHGGRAQE